MEPWQLLLVMAFVFASFYLSAAAGLGGSLILVPTLTLVIGAKEGIALAALLLAGNNVVKVWAYRRSLPWRAALPLIALTVVGALLGARALVALPEGVVTAAVLVVFALTLGAERAQRRTTLRNVGSPVMALAAGATSGVSGTSGPLKGVAIRSVGLDRLHTVGGASLMSLAGDVTKTAVFTEAQLLDARALVVGLAAVPLMITATFLGRSVNYRLGEQGYAVLFWLVMGGYSARLVLA